MEDLRKAIVVGVGIKGDTDFDSDLKELSQLVEACDMEPTGTFVQNLDKLHPVTYLGSGKLEELKEIIQNDNIEVAVFEGELSPTQLRNIVEILDIEVLDRTSVILEIFARRARTKDAMLQVEKAQLKYILPRLVGANQNLGRQGGGVGLSNKGSGEKKINLDRRIIEKRIVDINHQLKDLEVVKGQQRKRRDNSITPQVSLVGYTNAGKSTIMNGILKQSAKEDEVFVKDMVFATLDTTSRRIDSDDNQAFILSDTVGFIDKLPNSLLTSFETTLSESLYADLIVHVMDVSDENFKLHKRVTESTLQAIGVKDIPILNVYNKIDRLPTNGFEDTEDTIYVSALDPGSITRLVTKIKDIVFEHYVEYEVLIPYAQGDITSTILDTQTVLAQENRDVGTYLKIRTNPQQKKRYNEFCI